MARRDREGVRRPWLWILLTAGVTLSLLVRGVAEGADKYMMLRSASSFALLATLPAIGAHRDNWPWLWLTLVVHSIIGLPSFYYLTLTRGITTRAAIMSSEETQFAFAGMYTVFFLFIMLPTMRSRWLRFLALLIFFTGLVAAMFSAGRGSWFHAVVTTCILCFVVFRKYGIWTYLGRVLPKTLVYVALLAMGGLALLAITQELRNVGIAQTFTEAYSGLEARMTEKGSLMETLAENERWIEIQVVSATMSGSDWLFGKGLGAVWSDPHFAQGEARSMVHNTWLNCFFWGGVPLFLCVFWPLLWALREILFSRSPTAMCCAGFLLLMYWMFPFFLITDISTRWILCCITVGACRWHIDAARRGPAACAVPVALQ